MVHTRTERTDVSESVVTIGMSYGLGVHVLECVVVWVGPVGKMSFPDPDLGTWFLR